MSPDDSFADMEMQKQGGMLASGLHTIRGRSLDARGVPNTSSPGTVITI